MPKEDSILYLDLAKFGVYFASPRHVYSAGNVLASQLRRNTSDVDPANGVLGNKLSRARLNIGLCNT
jgi:hypothetical protein